jgi:Mn-containing catalase
MTEDPGIRDMLSFLIARDSMHQNQWIAAIAELEADGLDGTPGPMTFPREREMKSVANQFWNCSAGTESADGRWAGGPMPDGSGAFEYLETPVPLGPEPELAPGDPRLHGTPPMPIPPVAG